MIQEVNEDIDSEVNDQIRRGLGKLVPIDEEEIVHPRKEIYLDDIVSFKLGLLKTDEIKNRSQKIAADLIIQPDDQVENEDEGKVILLDDI